MRARRFITAGLALLLALGLLAGCGGNLTGVKQGRFSKPIVLKVNGSSTPAKQYAGVIQNQLQQVGIHVEIDAVDFNTMRDQHVKGQYEAVTNRWVGGNQDPVYLRDLFRTGAYQNRTRYSNSELDPILDEATTTPDRERARALYAQAQSIVSRDLPEFPLWFPAQMVVTRRDVGQINVDPSGDWRFMRDLTVQSKKEPFVVALESKPDKPLDQISGTDASGERLRQLMYNSLVKKTPSFEYEGELASKIETSPDGLATTFTLRDGVRFHNGQPLTSADAKHTLEVLMASGSQKATNFFEGTGDARRRLVTAIDTPDPRTLIVRSEKPLTKLLSDLVAVGIIPQGSTAAQQRQNPIGTGPFKFAAYDESQQVFDLAANENYWGGAPAIKRLRVRVILDANTLQAELRSGGIDLAVVGNLQPDAYPSLASDPNLQVKQFPGSNVTYIDFNTQAAPLNDARVRQAIAYAIDREGIVRDLMLGQATVAHSVLPAGSWAYAPGQQYNYDPEKARQILDAAGYK